MTTLFGIPNCDTIKRTRKWLDGHGIEYQFHDYKKQGCSTELIEQFLQHFTYQELINTRGTTWRKLPDSIKNTLNTESAIKLMNAQPSMIKRPLIQSGDSYQLGFNEQRLSELLT